MAKNTPMTVKNGSETQTHNIESTRDNYFTPRVDILETDTELLLFADMPGVSPGDIDLRYENGELQLRGKVQPTATKGHLVYGEYQIGDFYRVFQVHETIDAGKIDAEFKNGVLTVHLAKQEKVKPRQVKIQAR